MIAFDCSSCGKPLKVKDELAGKKVKCPGCQKPVAVPQPAGSVSPPPAASGDERTLPPKASASADEYTLPPKGSKESLSEADAHTNLGAGQAESTQAFPEKPNPELIEFLAPAEQPDELGRLGGFRILKILGHGGMGVVFQGEDPMLGRKVAIKAMLPHLAGSKSSQERFLREARAAAGLEHDHIVHINHVAVDRGAPFIVMPFLQGAPLDERLKQEKILPVAEVLRIGRETAKGLAAAHEKGLIHRDIKPANIWLEGRGVVSGGVVSGKGVHDSALTTHHSPYRVKILDFGLARAAAEESHLTQSGAIVGTPAYMAPEQAEGKKVDHRCDLFSLGCVLYRMCTGEMPFKGNDSISTLLAVASQNPPPPASINVQLPTELSDLVMQLLAKKPEDRPQSAQAVVNALQEIEAPPGDMTARPGQKTQKVKVAGKAKTETARTQTAQGTKKRFPLPWLVGGGVLGLAVLGLVVFFLTSRERQRPETPRDLYALRFDGRPNGAELLPFEMNPSQPFTFEAYCTRAKSGHKGDGSWPFYAEFAGISAQRSQWNFWMRINTDGYNPTHQVVAQAIDDSETHVAGVSTGKELLLFINGKLANRKIIEGAIPKPQGKPIMLGANYAGLLREIRISKIARYDKDFTPAKRFESDADTLALYHCDEGKGDVLEDSSGNGHDGKIVAAKWVKAEESDIDSSRKTFTNSLGMEFVLVPRGQSWLGGGGGKPGDKEIEIKEDFYLGKYEVTQEEWERVTGLNPSNFKAVKGISKEDQKRFPVEQVSRDDCQAFIDGLNKQVKDAGWIYRLPTEAEWEYACRGGPMSDKVDSTFDFYFDKPSDTLLLEQANFEHGKGLKRTCKVGSYKPNKLGLYDMHGNVWEWCDDEQKVDKGASLRERRGGSWIHDSGYSGAAFRNGQAQSFRSYDLGLRLARVPVGKEIVKIIAREEKKPPLAKGEWPPPGVRQDGRLGPSKNFNGTFPWTPPISKEAWQERRKAVREQVLVANGLWPMPQRPPIKATIHGKIDRDGYTIEKVFFASYPGHYVSGNLYRPTGKTGKLPAVLSPHGHWKDGRMFQADENTVLQNINQGAEKTRESARYPLQARCAQLARMGCIAFLYDMVGYADSQKIAHRTGFTDAEAELRLQSFMGLQTFNSIRALDFLVGLPDVDPQRIGVTGASGGGTQTVLICAVDDRPAAAFPAVMVSIGMQGGCVCENCSYLRVGTGNIELAALFAPRPLGMSGAKDWTIDIETKGLPELKKLYKLYGAEDNVMAKCYPQFGHNFNQVSRELMYNFFNKHLKLGQSGSVEEKPFVPVPPKDLSVFDSEHPLPKDATDHVELRKQMTQESNKQLQALLPKDEKSLAEFRRVIGTALRTMVADSLPPASEIEEVLASDREIQDGVYLRRNVLSRKGQGESVPAISLRPADCDGTVVVWIHPDGMASLWEGKKLSAAARQILDKKAAILAPDVFGTGALKAGRQMPIDKAYAGFTFGYNRPLLANRVHDILTAVAFSRASVGTRVHLVGWGKAGPWVVLARGLCGDAVIRSAADLSRFRFDSILSTDHEMMLPGALKYGGWPVLAGIIAPHPLLLYNIADTAVEPVIPIYQATGAQKNLRLEAAAVSEANVLEWVLNAAP